MAIASRERRWIILGDDGRHVTVGRHSDPSEDELDRAADALRANNQGGWLAVTEGRYYSEDQLSVLMVRELASPRAAWEVALAAFQAARHGAVAPTKRPEPSPGF
jgi:hypothetical protein